MICSIQLTTEHSIHLIEINRLFYVNSTEVSALLWDDDIVKTEVNSEIVKTMRRFCWLLNILVDTIQFILK